MEANAGEQINKNLHLKRFPHISLHCKLIPVQYGLLVLSTAFSGIVGVMVDLGTFKMREFPFITDRATFINAIIFFLNTSSLSLWAGNTF